MIAASWTPAALPGLLAEYRFNETSGNILTDYSGNGYNGTLESGTNTPSWITGGLSFGGDDGVTLPVPVGSILTAMFLLAPSTGFPDVFLGNDDPAGIEWRGYAVNPPAVASYAAPYLMVNGTFVSSSQFDASAAARVLTYVHDTTGDRLYSDGYPLTQQASLGTSYNMGRVGNLVLGRSPARTAGLTGKMFGVLLYDHALADAEVASAAAWMRSRAVAAGVNFAALGNTSTARTLVSDGDSISTDLTATNWIDRMSLAQTWDRWRWAIAGQTALQIAATMPRRSMTAYAPGAAKNLYCLMAGTNDVTSGRAVSATLADLQQIASVAIATGFGKVIVVPMLSRTGQDANKNLLNAAIAAASWPPGVSLLPTTALPHLVPDGSYLSATWFNGDGIHLTQAGEDEIAGAVAPLVNAFA